MTLCIVREFCEIDMKTTTAMLKFVKSVFPSFEFTWLGEEMEENLPLEMDFSQFPLLFVVASASP